MGDFFISYLVDKKFNLGGKTAAIEGQFLIRAEEVKVLMCGLSLDLSLLHQSENLLSMVSYVQR